MQIGPNIAAGFAKNNFEARKNFLSRIKRKMQKESI